MARLTFSGVAGDLAGNLPNPTVDPTKVAKTEPTTVPSTLYVDYVNGSDLNAGKSPGAALASITKAALLLRGLGQPGNPGEIRLVGGGTYLASAPLHFSTAVMLRGLTPNAVEIQRNFDTPNGRTFWDAVTTAAGSSVQSATAAFVAGDVNRIISVYGAGVSGGTYYDFISAVPDGTHATLTATTTIARNSTTDPPGVKAQIVGDWNRVVTDASMTSGQSTVTSVTAAWTSADVNTELVIAGAGRGGQALRTVITGVAGNTATVNGVASATVTNARCAISVNFGDLLTFHESGWAMRNVMPTDRSTSRNRIGSMLKLISDDKSGALSMPGQAICEHPEITSNDSAGAFEHAIDIDGSWQTAPTGPGARRIGFITPRLFGQRRAGETIRIAAACHIWFVGGGHVGSAPLPNTPQGIRILDPANTGGAGYNSVDQIHFSGFEGYDTYFYCEGSRCTFSGGSVGPINAISGRRAVELGPTSQQCSVVTSNATVLTGTNADEYDAGTNNRIETNVNKRVAGKGDEATIPTGMAGGVETFPRRGASNASQAVGSSGVLVCQAIWLPGGYKVSKLGLLCGGTSLAWGSGWTNPHFLYGLYDPDLNLIGQTADTGGTAVMSASGITLVSLSSAVRVPRSGICYIGLLINSGTGGSAFTFPSFGGMTNAAATLAPALCGTSGSGLTALPNPLVGPTAVNSEIYGGVA